MERVVGCVVFCVFVFCMFLVVCRLPCSVCGVLSDASDVFMCDV